jgi:hypothetical protein
MPSWANRFRKRSSTQTLRTTNGDDDGRKDKFSLPTNTKKVEEQNTAPRKLPAPNADADEVRYFLYHLLTYKGNKIARRWPQWVLETCAYWTGTGTDLRTWSEDFSLLVPKGAGYAELDTNSKYVDSPPGDCRLHIGNVIENTVRKLIAEEGSVANKHQEWIAKEQGSSSRQDHYRNPSGTFGNISGFQPSGNPRSYSTMSRTASCMSLPQSFTSQHPFAYTPSVIPSVHSTVARPYASSVHESMCAREATACQSSNMSPTSSGDSGLTRSTAKTTPPGSVEEGIRRQSTRGRYGARTQPLHPAAELSQQSRPSAYFPPPPEFPPIIQVGRALSDAGSCRGTLRPSRSHSHSFSNSSHVQQPLEDLQTHEFPSHYGTYQRSWQEQSHRPTSALSFQHAQTSTDSLHRNSRQLHLTEQLQRPGSSASVRTRGSRAALKGTPAPSLQQCSPIATSSLNYPKPDIAHTRDRTTSSSTVSSKPRSVAPSILDRFPIPEKPQVPHVNSFTSADRTFATASTDQFALTQGLYHYTRVTDPAKAYEVAQEEKARMQGMVPSTLRGELREPTGPSMRMLDPVTRTPMHTLYEVLEARETLQGKRT